MITRRNGHSLLCRTAIAAGIAAASALLMQPITAIAQDPNSILPDAGAKLRARQSGRKPLAGKVSTHELLVFLKPKQDPHRFAARHGMRIRRRLRSDRNAFVMVTASPAHALRLLPAVARDRETRIAFNNERINYKPTEFVPNDPYLAAQWHLINRTNPGRDARVQGAWNRDFTGEGVTIGIVDDGLEADHPDLADNVSHGLSWDFWDDNPDPSPHRWQDRHGTAVAGVAAGRGGNGIGITGAAPLAQIAGLRIELNGIQTTDQFVDATLWQSSGDNRLIHIKNHSYGVDVPYVADNSGVEALSVSTVTGGTIHVFAAGNERGEVGEDANKQATAASPDAITVAALGSSGSFSAYSCFGANIFVTAPSSGGRVDSAGNGTELRITTTDRAAGGGYNPYQPGDASSDPFQDTDYTSKFGGTSSASPLVAGVLALAKQAQPALNTRFAKHLLARTSDVVNSNDSTNQSGGGWKTNAAGFKFNQNYGFGLIDADHLTRLAPDFDGVNPLETESTGTINCSLFDIPDAFAGGMFQTFTLSSSTPLEEVQLFLDISHSYRGDLEAFLTSPSGTKCRMFCANVHDDADNLNWTFTSNAFWGENPRGTWTLTVRDLWSGDTGKVNRFEVRTRMGSLVSRISGAVYDDRNDNEVRDAGEPGLANQRLFIDSDADGAFDTGEPSVLTPASGHYEFINLPAGDYRVRLIVPSGLRQTEIPIGSYSWNLNTGRRSGKNYGLTTTGRISGVVWNDANGNGIRDTGEANLAGERVYVDSNRNGVWNTGEPSAVTRAVDGDPGSGLFILKGISPGAYDVRVRPSAGWRVTASTSGLYSVTITNSSTVSGRSFGLTQRATLSGIVWQDLDRNGVRGSNEPGTGSLRVYLDANDNSAYDSGEVSAVTSSKSTNLGAYTLVAPAGSYKLRVSTNAGIVYTTPKAGYHAVSLGAGSLTTRNFGLLAP